MMNHQEYYQKLALPPVPTAGLSPIKAKTPPIIKFEKYQEQEPEQQLRAIISEIEYIDFQDRLKTAMDNIVLAWTEKHDALVDALDDLERSKKKLEHRLSVQQQHYEKSMRETELYKTRYENCTQQQINYQSRRRSVLISSNASCLSGKSYVTSSSSARSSSCSSSMRTSFSIVDEIIDPTFFDQQLQDSDVDNNEFDLYSVVSNRDSCTLPNSPHMTPVMFPLSSSSTTVNNNNNNNESSTTLTEAEASSAKNSMVTITNIENEQTDALSFACGDGFWNTIARGRSKKAEVVTLISNYIRRGGNPNVAKNSDTVRNVKEGYGLIHAIIATKNTSALQRILEAGAKTNVYPLTSKLEDKTTPLVLAAKLGYMKGMRLLIEQGGVALLNKSRGPYGENALHAAVQSGSDEMAAYILRLSQNSLLEKVDKNGATPLHYACITGKTRLITLFIRDYQTRSDPRDNKGETPLHYAVRNRKLKVIAKLVGELGVYPNPYILKQVPTPLDLAKSGGLKTIAEYLKQVGAKTTKEMEKTSRAATITATPTTTIHSNNSSNSSTFSGESSASGRSAAVLGVRQFLHSKTSQILRGTFDL